MNPRMSLMVLFAAASVAVHAANHEVTAFADHQSAATALRVRPGDTITLPALAEGESYQAINSRVLSLDGNIATVLAPGMVGIQRLDSSGSLAATAAILAIPDQISGGRVYLWNPNHWSSANWCSGESETWELLAGSEDTDKDYPHLPNDIAILPRYNDWGYEITIANDISLGGLMIGAYTWDKNGNDYPYVVRGPEGGDASTLTFERTDGKEPFIQICPGSRAANGGGVVNATFGGRNGGHPININFIGKVVCDIGWDGTNPADCLARIKFESTSSLFVPGGSSLAFVNGSTYQNGAYFSIVEGNGALVGAGDVINVSGGSLRADFNASAFTGTLVEQSGLRAGYDRNGNTWIQDTDTFGSAGLIVRGYAKCKLDQNNRPHYIESGAGYFRIGSDHTWPGRAEIGNRLPGREVRLEGGCVLLAPEQTAWESGAKLCYETASIVPANGFTYISTYSSGDGYPQVYFAAQSCTHSGTATIAFSCNGLWGSDRASAYCPWYADQAIGGIVPWFAAYYGDSLYSWESLSFPVCEDGFLKSQTMSGAGLSDNADNSNAYVSNNMGMGISKDKIVNSLVVNNPNSNGSRCLGEGRKLTISSGGLIFNSNCSRIGDWKWGTTANEIDPASGTIEFTEIAYVFANCIYETTPNMILSTIVAPKGFVAAFPGFLGIASDQTGIDGEIVVNAGTLMLGFHVDGRGNNSLAQADVDFGCTIDVPVRIVGGGATLKINKAGTLASDQNVYFDDVGGYAGKLDIPEGARETCMKCYVDGVSLARGTWGASGSGADNVDDDHFSGLGVLVVSKDDLRHPMTIVVR